MFRLGVVLEESHGVADGVGGKRQRKEDPANGKISMTVGPFAQERVFYFTDLYTADGVISPSSTKYDPYLKATEYSTYVMDCDRAKSTA